MVCVDKEASVSPELQRQRPQQTLPAPAPDSNLPPPEHLTHLSIITVHMDPRASVLLLLLLCAASCTAAVPQDCCLSVAQQRLPANRIQSYKVQEAGKGCHISATGPHSWSKRLCLPHPEGLPWLQKVLKIVEQRLGAQQQHVRNSSYSKRVRVDLDTAFTHAAFTHTAFAHTAFTHTALRTRNNVSMSLIILFSKQDGIISL
ncbi:hypothetical protein WMY93_015514 [Mugilogobius chulae]|uniref:Chemokine interleukin-8-like domain-containing protein n=1 Tax=Mugilogobius chulae TaxID=88201 RepID=A0AAW0NRG0_9GOBI